MTPTPIRTLLAALLTFCFATAQADTVPSDSTAVKTAVTRPAPPIVRSKVGDRSHGVPGRLAIECIGKKQQYSGSVEGWDTDILSPKSVTFSHDGTKFYVNSLEGCRTVVYDTRTLDKIKVIHHNFREKDFARFAPPSGHYTFSRYADGETRPFLGKPVESAWSHGGRYLWVPYYRRSYDINAQEPSAIAVIDSRTDSIIRVFETGPLPKMVTVSNGGDILAITHWGDNTVGFIDIAGDDPRRWHHLAPVTVGYRLKLDFPLDRPVNRDANSGYLLRGTVFTPDDRYLLVSGMAGPLQVIDMGARRHIGSVDNLSFIRHLAVSNGRLYGSQNSAATVLSTDLDTLVRAVDRGRAEGRRRFAPGPVRRTRVGGGARTLSVSPDGKLGFVACNSGSAVYVFDTESMRVIDTIRCDSYPVGLALSPDGSLMAVTSQGRVGGGGNAVNIFAVDRFGTEETVSDPVVPAEEDSLSAANAGSPSHRPAKAADRTALYVGLLTAGCLATVVLLIVLLVRKRL